MLGRTNTLTLLLTHSLRFTHSLDLSLAGGSISHGHGASDHQHRWSSILEAWASQAFKNVTVRNGCIPGTPSGYMVMCLDLSVDQDVDIVFSGGAGVEERESVLLVLRGILLHPHSVCTTDTVFFPCTLLPSEYILNDGLQDHIPSVQVSVWVWASCQCVSDHLPHPTAIQLSDQAFAFPFEPAQTETEERLVQRVLRLPNSPAMIFVQVGLGGFGAQGPGSAAGSAATMARFSVMRCCSLLCRPGLMACSFPSTPLRRSLSLGLERTSWERSASTMTCSGRVLATSSTDPYTNWILPCWHSMIGGARATVVREIEAQIRDQKSKDGTLLFMQSLTHIHTLSHSFTLSMQVQRRTAHGGRWTSRSGGLGHLAAVADRH